jgi:ribonuclease R
MKITKENILRIMSGSKRGIMRFAEIMRGMNLAPTEHRTLRRMLEELLRDGSVAKFKGRQYAIARRGNLIEGTLTVASAGYGFVTSTRKYDEAEQPDVFIARRNLGSALDGDKVAIAITSKSDKGVEGRVVDILERRHETIAGQFFRAKRGGLVVPRNQRIKRQIAVPVPAKNLSIQNGNWVLVRVTDWTEAHEPLRGEIVELIGAEDAPGINILLVLRDRGIELDFPPEVTEPLKSIPRVIPKSEMKRRSDFRHLRTLTIDPVDAKDFDDALSIDLLRGGRFRLGVHIADVSHYAPEGGPLDLAARDRSTSIYPVDRVVPMLPELLSNNLCSLRPDEDRLAVSVIMDIDEKGAVQNYQIHNSVIRSSLRLTYEEVQSVFDESDSWAVAKCRDVRNDLLALKRLSECLSRMRTRRGALDLDLPETEVVFDSQGTVVNVRRHHRLASHRLVEECMLTANETVATHLEALRVPSLYRIHLPPRLADLKEILPILCHLGVRMHIRERIYAADLQSALRRTEQLHAGHIIRRLILRALMRAEYSAENKGHFGLASTCYTHFTSPIRRYPDLMVHRILKEIISEGSLRPERKRSLEEMLPEMAEQASERERQANGIEMEATTIKSLEFMQRYLGDEFEGFIGGVAQFGFFVELDAYPVDGLVSVRSLSDDQYHYDAERALLAGRRKGHTFKISDKVIVQIQKIDAMSGKMDLGFVRKVQ